ncbi:LysR family transcriptional regulator [Williamsia sp. CHRR-6]|uniref:LysR family transcriptional regulator n=1 Tax=Williamsia sp. CHRR-6 TaxID=2835871 RepID=UPI001BD9CB0D|nr:LysR family transcriptional regulator [Williamsia sp. CHRR-6]MBT0566415.1 LysR family transcriptional regulator [Williamsia sp. CHRR-6]
MDLHQLRCFDAVAEELHFGRAASRLHLTPSPVSRTVKELERELGTELFIRGYHSVELTSAGTALRPHVQSILAAVDALPSKIDPDAINSARVVRSGNIFRAPIGMVDDLEEVVASAAGGRPVQGAVGSSVELIDMVERGALDIAMVHLPHDRPGLESLVAALYTFQVAMRSDDELAAADEVELSDLAARTLIMGPDDPQPVAMGKLMADLAAAGVTTVHRVPDQDSARVAGHVRQMRGVTLTVQGRAGSWARGPYDHPGFAVRPIRGGRLVFELGLVWRRIEAERDPVVAELVVAARSRWPIPERY